MSETPGSRKPLAGWTMVDSKGEVMTDDSRSVSSESSTESFSLLQEDSTRDASVPPPSVDLPSEEVNAESGNEFNLPFALSASQLEKDGEIQNDASRLQADVSEHLDDSQQQQQFSSDETGLGTSFSASDAADDLIEKDGGLGACCEELMESAKDSKNQPDEGEECKVEEEEEDGDDNGPSIPLDVDDSIPSPNFQDNESREIRQRHNSNSDSDSDFVQIDEDNLEEFEAELTHRGGVPDRSPSIAEGFNFLGREGEAIRHELPGSGNASDEDFNEDTESSTEDILDDRIESDQSEVGSAMNNNPTTDVGDLSAFADIADLPLIVGDTARNYRHRPNTGLSSVLNVILIVVSLLTMGISIGLIMATDLEIEEWQTAYNMQVKKTSSLEWTLADFDRVVQDSKAKVNAYESVLESFSKTESPNSGSSVFFNSFVDTVTNFETCTRKHGRLSSVDCHAQVLPDVRLSLSRFKQVLKADDKDFGSPLERVGTIAADILAGILPKEEPINSPSHDQILQEMKLSIHREQERALHWQNLYLLERRQREWDRENEDLEDRRERAQWEKEDEEEDRRMRETWEREEEEEDRQERLMWEREDREQDRREREKWEKERADIDNLECLKKLMSSNLTFFRQHVMNWNVSAFDDFVNVSTLMLGIAEMKQSVLASVQQIWIEAEEALSKMGEDVKNGKQSYLDTSVMADYLKQALTILRSQFDDVVNVHANDINEKEIPDKKFSTKEKNVKGSKLNYKKSTREGLKTESRKDSSPWNKMFGKMFKKTSKSLRKFVRTVSSSWTEVMTHWDRSTSYLMKSGKTVPENSDHSFTFPSWLQGTACQGLKSKKNALLDVGSPCVWEVRETLTNLLLKEPCGPNNHYSLACNTDAITVWKFKRDLKKILGVDTGFRGEGMGTVDGTDIVSLFAEFWRKWETSELLLKFDRDWVSCSLREWSGAVNSEDGWTKATGDKCHRFIYPKTLVVDTNSWWTTHIRDKSKEFWDGGDEDKSVEDDDVDSDSKGDDRDGKYRFYFSGFNNEKNGVDVDSEEDGNDMNYEFFFSQFNYANDDDVSDYDYDDIHDNPLHKDSNYAKSEDSDQSEKNSGDKEDPAKRNVSLDDLMRSDSDDDYKQSAWYLKRAQYRLQMRRAHEKTNWFLDMSDHRDEMRKEHNVEKKSAQWLFDLAEDREGQRRKDHASDWLFERAQHRREESSRKWAPRGQQPPEYEKEIKVNADDHCVHGQECFAARERRKKMEDLSRSDWLLQNNGGRGRGGRAKGKDGGRRKGENGFQNAHKKTSHTAAGKKSNGQEGRQHRHHKKRKAARE